jgi:hypothetical protein
MIVKRLSLCNGTNTLTSILYFHFIPIRPTHHSTNASFCKKYTKTYQLTSQQNTNILPQDKKYISSDYRLSKQRVQQLKSPQRGKWRTKGKGDLNLYGRQTCRYQISTSTIRFGHLRPNLGLVDVERGQISTRRVSHRRTRR